MTGYVPMTREAYNRRKAEVDRLEHEEIPKIAEKIAAANPQLASETAAKVLAQNPNQADVVKRAWTLRGKSF